MTYRFTAIVCLILLATPALPAADVHALLDSPVKTDFNPDAIGDVAAFIAHSGTAPLGITEDKTASEIIVADVSTGTAYRYDKGLTAMLGSITIPMLSGSCTGVAFNETTGNTLFLVYDNDQVQEITMAGAVVGAPFTLAGIAGLPAGISYALAGTDGLPSLWVIDIVNDIVYEHDLTGTQKSSFVQPGAPGCYGNGIDATGNMLDILWGLAASGAVTDVSVRANTGTTPGYPDTPVGATADSFVNDVLRSEQPPGTQVLYLVGNSTNTIFMVETAQGVPVELISFEVE